MAVKVAINGFGRIGRLCFRAGYQKESFDIVAVNDLTDANTLAHLLKFDSVHGKFNGRIEVTEAGFSVDGKEYRVYAEKDPAKLPWKELGVEIVIEATGKFRKRADAEKHLSSGAEMVILTAPGRDEIPAFVMGVNEQNYNPTTDRIISNASCTTNCFAPIVKVLHEKFKIRRGFMTTIHAYTNDQRILDFPHKDLRRARAAMVSMIPTSTGAAKAIIEVFPDLAGRLDAIAVRVPVADASMIDFICELESEVDVESINRAMADAANGPLKGILEYCTDPIVSADIIGNPHSAVFDSLLTKVIKPNLCKVIAWYDNEWAYAVRVIDLLEYVLKRKG
ncbi:type I glyceraldehyde-3-phosphate dehydrogenase [candidate division WOR-3 bacterium]|uniref:Type I glyceraldehyde-3-phosphate dehydrogenase n=1 Tax=candidate division WOR-3 bacterium TaxID=2052148 RepID=A0A660SN71_UNCW3|nr:MAG: type I glyceraldehyde-3-phosphate dehydrogenase [candidate division WOR-3 bacterium]